MKKIIPFLALAILISSCGNKMTLLKRHYTKGYYVQSSKSPNKTGAFLTEKVSVNAMEPVVAGLSNEPKQPSLVASLKTGAKKDVEKSYQGQLRVHSAAPGKFVSAPAASLVKRIGFSETLFKSRKKGGDANIIVLVILALFPILCLIAVYLHDNGITTNFWVDLLLHLTLIGEIIFALLVVLDVVSFA